MQVSSVSELFLLGVLDVHSNQLQTQLQKEYYKPYLAATEPLFVKPREYKLYSRLGKPFYTAKDQ